jgi:hypothetical protein
MKGVCVLIVAVQPIEYAEQAIASLAFSSDQQEHSMIQGYPDQPSVLPGGTLTLHISTDSPQFRVDFYRQGQTLDFKQSSGWLTGKNIPGGQPNQDWGWPGYDFPVPADWTSGVYIAMFVQADENGNVINPPDPSTADARDSKALFVVKSSAPGSYATILYKLPFFTYQAYNKEGGWSLYQGAPVTIHRPGGGTGGTPWDIWNWDPFDSTPRQTFVHWDVPFISWLEGNGYRVDYCTDLDIQKTPTWNCSARTLYCSVWDTTSTGAMPCAIM